jgi:hypothetical protein
VKVKWGALPVLAVLAATLFTEIAYAGTCPDGPAMQRWRAQRQQLFNMADAYKRAGMGVEYIPARAKLEQFTASGHAVFLEQEIRNFPLFGNVQCLLWAMNGASGQNLNLQPYSDGTYDLLVGKNKIRSRISSADLLAIAKSLR